MEIEIMLSKIIQMQKREMHATCAESKFKCVYSYMYERERVHIHACTDEYVCVQ